MLSLCRLCCHFGVKTDPGASSLAESVIGPFRLVGVAGVPALVLRTFCSGFGGSHKVSGPVSIISTLRLFDVS